MEDVVAATPTSQPTSQSSSSSPPAPAKKSSTTLSVDRAAFLLLRVKKAFKRKRQHRKEKQAQALNASLNNQPGRTNRGKIPPPLLRSRTLPAIIVPGIPVVSLHTDKSQFPWERLGSTSKSSSTASTGSGNRWSLLTRNTTTTTPTATQHAAAWHNNNNNNFNNNNNTLSIKSLNLPKDDATLVYRRKSSGSTPHGSAGNTTTTSATTSSSSTTGVTSQVATQQYGGGTQLQTPDGGMSYATSMNNTSTDDFECYAADGSVLLRIPAPHVVAARAYRLASKKRTTSSIFGSSGGGNSGGGGGGGGGGGSGGSSTSTSDNNTRCSGNNTPTKDGGYEMSAFSGCGNIGYTDTNINVNSNTISGFPSSSFLSSASSTSTATTSNASTNTALTRRLAKLLHQSSASVSSKSQQQQQQQTQYDINTFNTTALTAPQQCGEDAPRRLSWERRKDSSALQRSASIDSFAEIVWCDSPRPSLDIPKPAVAPFSKRPSASSLFSNCSTSSQSTQWNINELCVSGSGGSGVCGVSGGSSGLIGGTTSCGVATTANSRRESLLSPSSTRRNKLTRIINGKWKETNYWYSVFVQNMDG